MTTSKLAVPAAASSGDREDRSPVSAATTQDKATDDNASTASRKRRRKEEGANGVKDKSGKPKFGRRILTACLCFRRPKTTQEDHQPSAREVDGARDISASPRVVTPANKAPQHQQPKAPQADSGIEPPTVDAPVENEKANEAVKEEPPKKEEPAKKTETLAVLPEKVPSTAEKKEEEKPVTSEKAPVEPEAQAEENKIANEKAAVAAPDVSKAPITSTLETPEQTVKPDEAGPLPEAPAPPEPTADNTEVHEDDSMAKSKIDAAEIPLPTSDGASTKSADEEVERPESQDGKTVQDTGHDQARWLLPPVKPEFEGKKCLVLDLDETLVHSSFKVRIT